MSRIRTVALVSAGVFALAPATAGAATSKAKTKTYTIKSGTTTLTLDPAAVTNLASMGITMSATAPATTAGPVLTFPVKAGAKIKLKGTTPVSGKIVHLGTLQMARDVVTVPLTNPTVNLTKPPQLTGTFASLTAPIGDLTIKSSKIKITKKTFKITGVTVKLTTLAADTMNNTFAVTGFHGGDPVGTANVVGTLKR